MQCPNCGNLMRGDTREYRDHETGYRDRMTTYLCIKCCEEFSDDDLERIAAKEKSGKA